MNRRAMQDIFHSKGRVCGRPDREHAVVIAVLASTADDTARRGVIDAVTAFVTVEQDATRRAGQSKSGLE